MWIASNFRLKQHIEQYHAEENPQCKVCDEIFENRAEQGKHNKNCLRKSNKLKYMKKNTGVQDSETSADLNIDMPEEGVNVNTNTQSANIEVQFIDMIDLPKNLNPISVVSISG